MRSLSPRAPGAFRPGDVVAGHLRVEALLGQGGAGAVYRVADQRKGLRLALKQLIVGDDDRKLLMTTHFAREYHTLAQLAHPHIIEVHEYGVEEGTPYYTMELLDGEDLHERGKLGFRAACGLLRDVASSLAVLHARGLVHRDVSARNVRCTESGGAKLLDFGAMVQVGTIQRVVGTPPFVAPEVLQMQALDARADLYSLGALAYWTLTGRHAYPATTLTRLRDAWRRPPQRITDFAPDVPEALAALVLSLLRLDRAERPRTAAEVMERLSGIAGLPLEEVPEVGRAYLVTPSLVGRDPALHEARTTLSRTLQTGRGASVLIEGAPGVGRSRFLDACVLESKLMGTVVLRGAPADATSGDYGVVRALLGQLLEIAPELCELAAHPRASLLAHLMRELAPNAPVLSAPPERRHMQAALRDFFLSVAREKHIVLAVDDIGLIDEPSAALLGALAHGASRRRLNLFLTFLQGTEATGAARVIREISERIQLSRLDAAQTEMLLGSVFGDSPRIATLAQHVHPLCQGRPRDIMALAEHLVSRGVVRYEAGSWTLPLALSDDDLPRSDQDVLASRLGALSQDARGLAEALALTDVRAFSLPQYAALTEHVDAARTFAALDELVQRGLLLVEGERYRLSASDVLRPLVKGLSTARLSELHARISHAVPKTSHSGLRLSHMLQGGREREAIDELLSDPPSVIAPGRLEALVSAVDAANRLGLAIQVRLGLAHAVAAVSALTGRCDLFDRYGWPLIERLRRDSGLCDYFELDATLDKAVRLERSLQLAQARYDATARDERGFHPHESMQRLMSLHGSAATIGSVARDLDEIERLGSLDPWSDVAPVIALLELVVAVAKSWQMGRFETAAEQRLRILQALDGAEGLAPSDALAVRLGNCYMLASHYAGFADPDCERWIHELDAYPSYRGNAWRARMIYALAQGDRDRALECERRAELLDLQDSGHIMFEGTTSPQENLYHALNEDVPGAKRSLARIAKIAPAFRGWAPTLSIAQAQQRRLQSDLEGALEALVPALEFTAVGRHMEWDKAADVHVQLLVALGRADEAVRHGLRYVADSEKHGIPGHHFLRGATAEALLASGRVEEARAMSEAHIADHRRTKIRGIRLGRAYETRAFVAIAMRDAQTFRECAERCAEEYLRGRNPGPVARYERLQRAALEAGILVDAGATAPRAEDSAAQAQDAARTVYSRMLTCVSPAERAERALQLLLEATGARTGYFFGLRSAKLELLFSPEEGKAPAALTHMMEECLRRELATGLGLTQQGDASPQTAAIASPIDRFIDELGRDFEPLILAGIHDGEAQIVGVAALHYPEDGRSQPRRAMLDAVIEALIGDDVVDPITCIT